VVVVVGGRDVVARICVSVQSIQCISS